MNLKGVRRRRGIRVEMVLPIRLHVRGIAFVDETTRAIARRPSGFLVRSTTFALWTPHL